MPNRRQVLKSAAGVFAGATLPRSLSCLQEITLANGAPLPAWTPGTLEIHHIDTGRGNAALVLGPDGTSMLIDAGEAHSAERTMAPARPDASRRPGEWIARYVQRQLTRTAQPALDLMLLTHLHGDHVGEVTEASPKSARGDYRLTGAADVAEALEVRTLIDRGWPDYSYPASPRDATSLNYIALAKSMAGRGTSVQKAHAGSTEQLALRHNAAQYPNFHGRILSVNGSVWTGSGNGAKSMFPPINSLPAAAMPTENMCCIALELQYGAFKYYYGGDLTCDTSYGLYPWHDIETPVAEAAGTVSVAVANHHGYFDACGPAFVRALRARAWVLPTWHVSHPAMSTLANLFSTELYPDERLVFATGMTPQALLTTERFSSRLAGYDGHVVVRVAPPGTAFTVHMVNARDERGIVEKSFGPLTA